MDDHRPGFHLEQQIFAAPIDRAYPLVWELSSQAGRNGPAELAAPNDDTPDPLAA
jgi:hypothetical protein